MAALPSEGSTQRQRARRANREKKNEATTECESELFEERSNVLNEEIENETKVKESKNDIECGQEDPLSALLNVQPKDEKSETTLNDERAFDKIEFQFEEFKQYKMHNIPQFGKIRTYGKHSNVNINYNNNNNNNNNNSYNNSYNMNDYMNDNVNGNDSYFVDSNSKMNKNGKALKKERPNYFIALKITNMEMKRKLKEIQLLLIDKWLKYDENILSKCKCKDKETFLSKLLIDESYFHITLNSLYCKDDDTTFEVLHQFDRFGQTIFQKLVPYKLSVKLNVENLSYFRNGRVIYAAIKDDNDRNKLENVFYALQTLFEKQCGIQFYNKRFSPHLTLIKLNKLDKKIEYPIQLLAEIPNVQFGAQFLTKLDFCNMQDERHDMSKQEKDYYQCIASIQPVKLRP